MEGAPRPAFGNNAALYAADPLLKKRKRIRPRRARCGSACVLKIFVLYRNLKSKWIANSCLNVIPGVYFVILPAEAVKRAALALQCVHDIKCGHRFAARVLRICDRVANDVLQENPENGARLVVDEARDPLHAPAAGKAADGRFRDSRDAVAQNLPVSFRAALAESFAAFRGK